MNCGVATNSPVTTHTVRVKMEQINVLQIFYTECTRMRIIQKKPAGRWRGYSRLYRE